MKICSRCGNNLTWNRSFCPLCGGLIVERPDDAATGQGVVRAPIPPVPEPVPVAQPEPTSPSEANAGQPQAEPVGIPTVDSAMPPAVPGVPPVPQAPQADYPVAPQPAAPIYDLSDVPPDPYAAQAPQGEGAYQGFEMPSQAEPQQAAQTDPIIFPPLDGVYGSVAGAHQAPPQMPFPPVPDVASQPQANEPPALPQFGQELTADAAHGAYPGADLPAGAGATRQPQPKQAASAPFLGIMRGSSSGRVELTSQRARTEPQPDGGAFERLGAREEIKAHPAGVPNVDMFSRKRESLIPQPEIPEAGPARDGLKPGLADSQRVVGFTPPVHAPERAAEPAQAVPPLQQPGVPPQLFTEAAMQPPVPSEMTGTISLGSATPPTVPQIPAMPTGAVPLAQPEAQTIPTIIPPVVSPPLSAQPMQQTAPMQPTPTAAAMPLGATPPPMPTPMRPSTVPQPVMPRVPVQPPAPAPAVTMPLGATPPPIPTPMPPAPAAWPEAQQVAPAQQTPPAVPATPLFGAPQQVLMQQPAAAHTAQPMPTPPLGVTQPQTPIAPTAPTGGTPLPAAPGAQAVQPAQPPRSKFAELIPQSQQSMGTTGQPQPAQGQSGPPQPAAPEEKKAAVKEFQPFQMGEFLKMFPEAKPD